MNIVTCHHFRHETLPIFYAGIERIRKDFDVQVYVAVSKGDGYSAKVARQHMANVLTYENTPLGRKWNAIYRKVPNNEVCVIMGEDDLISSELAHDLSKVPAGVVTGVQSFGFIEASTGRCGQFSYTDDCKLIGAGRAFVKKRVGLGRLVRPLKVGDKLMGVSELFNPSADSEVLGVTTKVEDFPYLWDDGLNNGLDRSSDATLCALGYRFKPLSLEGIHILDVKTDKNLWAFDHIRKRGADANFEELTWFLSRKELALINKLKR